MEKLVDGIDSRYANSGEAADHLQGSSAAQNVLRVLVLLLEAMRVQADEWGWNASYAARSNAPTSDIACPESSGR